MVEPANNNKNTPGVWRLYAEIVENQSNVNLQTQDHKGRLEQSKEIIAPYCTSDQLYNWGTK